MVNINEKNNSTSKGKFTAEDLKRLQSGSLNDKIGIAQARITEFISRTDGKFYVSFSGGKDSTVLAYITAQCCCLMGNKKLTLWYSDTGLEYPELKKHVKSYKEFLQNEFPELEIELVIDCPRNKDGKRISFKQVIEGYGYPLISKEVADNVYRARRGSKNAIDRMNGLNPDGTPSSFKKANVKWKFLLDAPFEISNKCCTIMKKKPAKKFEKESGLHPIIGTMACESAYRKTGWLRTGCNAFDSQRISSQPLSVWLDSDVLEYIVKYHLPYPSVYGDILQDKNGKYYTTGCDRTGCMYCGFGCQTEKKFPNRFQRLKQTHPMIWEYCMKPWNEGGLGMKEVLEYINVEIE